MKNVCLIIIFLFLSFQGFSQRSNIEALGKEYIKNAEYDKAETVYKKLHQNDPVNIGYYTNYLLSLSMQDKFGEAEKVIKKMLKKSGNHPLIYIDLGLLYDQQGQKDKSNKAYQDAIKNVGPELVVLVEVTKKFTDVALYDQALQTIQKGRKLSNNSSLMSMEASKIYNLQNNKQGIIEEQINLFESSNYNQEQIQQTLQNYLDEPKDYELLKSVLLTKLQQYPDQIYYSELLIWTFIQLENFEAALFQSIALDKRLNEDGVRIYQLGEYCRNNKAYETAVKCFQAVIDKGGNYASNARISLLSTRKEKVVSGVYTTDDLKTLEIAYQDYLKNYGQESNAPLTMKEYAQLLALYLNRPKEAISILENILQKKMGITSFQAACKLDLGDYYLLVGEIWDAALLYGQVDKAYKDEPLGQMAKFRNARLSYYAGEFEWSKAQLDILKASTSQLIANDALNLSLLISDHEFIDSNQYSLKLFSSADLLVYQHRYSEAITKLDSIDILFPGNDLVDDILWIKADIQIQKQSISAAIEYLQTITDKHKDGIWADDALFLMAELYEEKLKNEELAMKCYQRIIDEFPGSLFVVEARKRFRNLRGS